MRLHRSVASRDPRPARASRAPRAPTRAPAKVLSQSQTWSLNSDLDPPLDPSQAEAVAAAAAAAASVPDCQQSPTQGHGACRGQKEGGKASRSEINPESMRFVPTSLTRQFISSVPAEAFPSKTKPTSSVGTIRQARRRQDTSPPPAFPAPTYTAIQDPSLGAILQPDRQTDPGTALASSTSPSTATTTTTTTTTTDATTSTNSLPTAITVTIVLATVAGLATLSLASFVLYLRWKRRRSGSSRVSSGLHLEDDSKRHCNNNNSSPSAPSPPLPPPPPPHSPVPFTASFGMGIDSISASENGTLTPPPRLLERKYHNSTKSDSSIELVRKYTHTRWGKPSSLSILSSSSPTQEPQPAAVYQPFGQREDSLFRDPRTPPLAGPSYRHGDKMNQHVFPAGSASPRTQGAVSGTPTSSSIYSNLLDSSSLTSPPRTPNVPPEVMGLASPGPPPNRALPSPPLKHWQVNPLSPPPDTEIDHIRPEDIGIAIGSPSYSNDSKRREKRPRLDESDMERLGGTYSPFKR
ncbi:hypothetical protein QQS21_008943 [Conoideocrella luteorostrata]|uniref:Uncharacterized protein n=1 Tax=Conoideocrella luteorostrata TaxID=1105319 RepID=A0AAJ0FW38_9HYPO|nr:hypothetical protein QQS21_008943 [Conoideocrella luteorostrata]